MNPIVILPVLWIFLLIVFFAISKRKNNFTLFRQIIWQLLGLFLISTGILFFKSAFLKKFPYSPKILFFLWFLFLLFLMVLVVRILSYLIFDILLKTKEEGKFPKIFKDIAVILFYVAGIFLILNYYLHIKITLLLASSAVLTVIFGLAVQDVLGNIFSGIALHFDDSCVVGNWIRIGELEGKIEQFGWRSMKIRTVENQVIVIPNQTASKAELRVFGGREQRPFAIRIYIGVSYKQTPDKVIETIFSVVESIHAIVRYPKPSVYVHEFADFSIVYEIRYWISDLSHRNQVSSEIHRRIWYAFSRNKIQIPYPIRDIYIRKDIPVEISQEMLISALKKNEILRVLRERDFHHLLQGMDYITFGKNEIIIKEGEESFYFYHIFQGELDILKSMKPLAVLKEGDFFGEISLVTGEKTSATVQTRKESIIIRIPSAVFRETVQMDPEMAKRLSDVIIMRQEQQRLFSVQEAADEHDRKIEKQSDNLFRRIIAYFGKPIHEK